MLSDEVREKLLSIDGTKVEEFSLEDEILQSLLAHGKLMDGYIIRYIPMSSEASENVEEYSKTHRDVQTWVGFALLGDAWQSHSWAIRHNSLIETIMPMQRYYGIPIEV